MSWWIAGAAAVGALADRKKPLRGAAMGAGLMATGGAAAGAFGAAGAGAGAAGAGAAGGAAAGTGAAAAGGATAAGTTAAGSTAAGGGLLSGTASGAAAGAPSAGFGLGQPLVSGTMGSSATATGAAAPSTGLLGSINTTLSQYKPAIDAAGMGIQMSGLLSPQQQQSAPEVQQMQGGSQTLAQIAGQGVDQQMQGDMQERMRRRQMMRGGV